MPMWIGRWPALLLALVLAGATAPARTAVANEGGREDHDEAFSLVEAGVIRPLPDILADLEGVLGGRIIEVALDHEGNLWVYELTLLAPGGNLLEVAVDAASGSLLSSR